MSRTRLQVVRLEVAHQFGVSVAEGFEYITDPANWPAYWPRFVRLDPTSRWREPGDRARLTLRLLAREVELEMTLDRLDPCSVVEYTSQQRGLPRARHWRHFDEVDGGLAYRIAIEYSPRPGWRGLLDRTLVRQAITRTARETMTNLDRLFPQQRSPAAGAAGGLRRADVDATPEAAALDPQLLGRVRARRCS